MIGTRIASGMLVALVALALASPALADAGADPPSNPKPAPPASPPSPVPQAAAPAPPSTPSPFSLDEYVVTAADSSGAYQLAGGITLGNSFGTHYYGFWGGRLSWVQVEHRGGNRNGWALGGVAGLGFRPDRLFAPILRIGVDKLFTVDDLYGLQAVVSAGVRIRVSPRVPTHYAISFEVFRNGLMGASGVPDRNETGILVGYSVGFFQKR